MTWELEPLFKTDLSVVTGFVIFTTTMLGEIAIAAKHDGSRDVFFFHAH